MDALATRPENEPDRGRRLANSPVDSARSAVMALVKSRDTKPELRVRRAFHVAGLRYRLRPRDIPGSPDLAFRGRRVAVFVHGCFWHRHENCRNTRTPKSRIDFWEAKFAENMARDERVRLKLVAMAWTPVVIWECETRDTQRLEKLAAAIRALPTKKRG